MNEHITFGLFALYVACVSLVLVLIGQQDNLLLLLRRIWGRTLGHSLYFCVRVALPMLVCVFCLGWGIRHYDAALAFKDQSKTLQLNVESYREMVISLQKEMTHDSLGILYGA